jgi:hypothetical protein
MKRYLLLLLLLLLPACSTVEVRKAPEFSCSDSIQLSRVLYGGAPDASGLTTAFSEADREVVARLACTNLVNGHSVTWKWYQPDGTLYTASEPTQLAVATGNYVPAAQISHRISVSGEAAAPLEGSWEVRAFLDNSTIATKRFTLAKLPDLLELVRSYRPVPLDYRKYAIVIGIETYTETTAARFAARDALVMQELFMRRFGVPEKNIISLVNEKATLGAIRNQLGNKLHGLPEDATLYVFYSGHGAPTPPKEGDNHGTPYIIPYDGNPTGLDQTGLSLQDFYSALNKLPAANIFVFLDSCFSGTTTGRYAEGRVALASGVKAVQMYIKDPALVSPKVVSFSSSQNDQLSNSSERDKMGLFTSQFVRSLVSPESPLTNKTTVTVAEMFDYLKQGVQSESLRTWGLSRKQTPTLRMLQLEERSGMSVFGD